MLSYCLPQVGAFPGVGWRQTGCGWRDNPGFISLKAKWKLMLARTLMETEQDRVQTAKQQLALAVGLRLGIAQAVVFYAGLWLGIAQLFYALRSTIRSQGLSWLWAESALVIGHTSFSNNLLASLPPRRGAPCSPVCANQLLGPGPVRAAASKLKFVVLSLQLYKNNGSSSTGSKKQGSN